MKSDRRKKLLAEALKQARLAYQLAPGHAMRAVIAAADAEAGAPDWIKDFLDWNVSDQPTRLAADTENHLDQADGPLR
jgi:hypothetical protein